MRTKVSKYFDNVFHRPENYTSNESCIYQLNFKDEAQKWHWSGLLDRNGNRILRNFVNYAADTYIAIDSERKIVGGYSYILESGYEGSVMDLIPTKKPNSSSEER
ncbi:hypothetical protein [Pseudoalteromonas marina]|uniref:Uncharacterized protein n=2 Tax=Bacteria TaxID=2 RepID=A0ABT9FJ06_9GAMM|nr:hypothetical protein [Pseudoalteromonas marina]MDP2566466.1 hypothetical protein [Pseudoalteromonas marina]